MTTGQTVFISIALVTLLGLVGFNLYVTVQIAQGLQGVSSTAKQVGGVASQLGNLLGG